MAGNPKEVVRKEGKSGTKEEKAEMKDPQPLVKEDLIGRMEEERDDFGESVVEARKQTEHSTERENLMEMSNYVIRVVESRIKRTVSQHDPRQAAVRKPDQEADDKKESRREVDIPQPHSCESTKHFDPSRNRDDHSSSREVSPSIHIHADREHMMSPHDEAENAD